MPPTAGRSVWTDCPIRRTAHSRQCIIGHMSAFPYRSTVAFLVAAAFAALLTGCAATSSPTIGAESATAVAVDTPELTAPASVTKAKPETTVAQQQAIKSAQTYVDMSGFSRAGLIKQLTSSYGEGFKKADAVYAVNHIKVDWNAEAVESAKSYLKMGGFSRAGLIQQLHSSAGDGFTLKQATYAANKVGL